MPYQLRKAPKRDAYWVVNKETGKHYSKEPLPKERAKEQMKALYAAEGKADVVIPKKEFIKEHKQLLDVLKSQDPKKIEKEYKKQAKELKGGIMFSIRKEKDGRFQIYTNNKPTGFAFDTKEEANETIQEESKGRINELSNIVGDVRNPRRDEIQQAVEVQASSPAEGNDLSYQGEVANAVMMEVQRRLEQLPEGKQWKATLRLLQEVADKLESNEVNISGGPGNDTITYKGKGIVGGVITEKGWNEISKAINKISEGKPNQEKYTAAFNLIENYFNKLSPKQAESIENELIDFYKVYRQISKSDGTNKQENSRFQIAINNIFEKLFIRSKIPKVKKQFRFKGGAYEIQEDNQASRTRYQIYQDGVPLRGYIFGTREQAERAIQDLEGEVEMEAEAEAFFNERAATPPAQITGRRRPRTPPEAPSRGPPPSARRFPTPPPQERLQLGQSGFGLRRPIGQPIIFVNGGDGDDEIVISLTDSGSASRSRSSEGEDPQPIQRRRINGAQDPRERSNSRSSPSTVSSFESRPSSPELEGSGIPMGIMTVLARAAYSGRTPLKYAGFELIRSTPTMKFFLQTNTNTIVVSVRGTASSDDVSADIAALRGNLKDTMRYKNDEVTLKEIQSKYPPSKYNYIGVAHSLGGGILDLFLQAKLIKNALSYNPLVEPQFRKANRLHRRIYNEKDPLYQLFGEQIPNVEVRKQNDPLWKFWLKFQLPLGIAELFGMYDAHKIQSFLK